MCAFRQVGGRLRSDGSSRAREGCVCVYFFYTDGRLIGVMVQLLGDLRSNKTCIIECVCARRPS